MLLVLANYTIHDSPPAIATGCFIYFFSNQMSGLGIDTEYFDLLDQFTTGSIVVVSCVFGSQG